MSFYLRIHLLKSNIIVARKKQDGDGIQDMSRVYLIVDLTLGE